MVWQGSRLLLDVEFGLYRRGSISSSDWVSSRGPSVSTSGCGSGKNMPLDARGPTWGSTLSERYIAGPSALSEANKAFRCVDVTTLCRAATFRLRPARRFPAPSPRMRPQLRSSESRAPGAAPGREFSNQSRTRQPSVNGIVDADRGQSCAAGRFARPRSTCRTCHDSKCRAVPGAYPHARHFVPANRLARPLAAVAKPRAA